jgi:hypothetical protein
VANVFLAVVGEGEAERPIFQYAGIPARYQGPDGPVDVMVSVDTMTDPDFRRRGLLTEVGRHAYDHWRQAGIAFVVGLPNQQWGSRASALGWQEVSRLRWRVRLLRPERTAARRLGVPLLARLGLAGAIWNGAWRWSMRTDATVSVRRVTSPAAALDRLWSRLAGEVQDRYRLVRDGAWVAWRYLTAPGASYSVWLAERSGEPVGYCVASTRTVDGRQTGYLCELLTAAGDDGARHSLVRAAVDALAGAGAESVATLATPGTDLDRTLRRAGFLTSWGDFSAQIVTLQPGARQGAWDFSGGDFDVT